MTLSQADAQVMKHSCMHAMPMHISFEKTVGSSKSINPSDINSVRCPDALHRLLLLG